MAWTESCKIDANKQVHHLKEKGFSARQAIKKLSDESGIPENTINNWIYERTGKKRVDAFYHMYDVIHAEMVAEGDLSEEKVKDLPSKVQYIAKWACMWLCIEDEFVLNWYRDAFEKHGGNIRLTDMFRTGFIYCNCPNCDGNVHKHDPLKESALTPEIKRVISPKGYVNFSAIQEAV
ncbi:MAG: hypothetical protein ISS59_00945 [Desulfobacteraceae bacterium]|nr:hypothetical protein [Desulfobacteraceae bacterium]